LPRGFSSAGLSRTDEYGIDIEMQTDLAAIVNAVNDARRRLAGGAVKVNEALSRGSQLRRHIIKNPPQSLLQSRATVRLMKAAPAESNAMGTAGT
jgi:hypothetical protein